MVVRKVSISGQYSKGNVRRTGAECGRNCIPYFNVCVNSVAVLPFNAMNRMKMSEIRAKLQCRNFIGGECIREQNAQVRTHPKMFNF